MIISYSGGGFVMEKARRSNNFITRFYAVVLVLAVAAALAFVLPAQPADAQELNHGNHSTALGWKIIFSEADIPIDGVLTDGSYCLAGDIALTSSLIIRGDVTLCLNGYMLEGSGDDSVIKTESGSEFTLCDCNGSNQTHVINGVAINGGVITGGSAYQGGGIYIGTQGTFNMTGGTVAFNSASYGGGIYIAGNSTYSSTFIMAGGSVIGNEVTGDYSAGGGIFVTYSEFVMEGGSVADNFAGESGSFGVGGGIQADFSTVTLIGGSVCGNYSSSDGGGIYVTDSEFTMGGKAVVSGNEALYGAGVEAWYSSLTIDGGVIEGNSAYELGGGLYAGICELDMSGGVIEGNDSYQGAGIYFGGNWRADDNEYTITISGDALIQNNISEYSGGGLYLDFSKLVMNGGAFIGNEAKEGYGGGILAYNTCVVTIKYGEISRNKAYYGGGACVQYSLPSYIAGGSFTFNSATEGGGIYVEDGELTMSGGVVANNSARSGGGIYLVSTSVFDMSGGIVTGNSAKSDYYGGGVYADGATVKMSGSPVISNNTAGDIDNDFEINRTTGNYIIVNGAFESGARIGLIDQQMRSETKFTEGYSEYNNKAPSEYFFADNGSYAISLQEFDGGFWEAAAVAGSYTVVYTAPDGGQKKVTYTIGEDIELEELSDTAGNPINWTLVPGKVSADYTGGMVVTGGIGSTDGETVYLWAVTDDYYQQKVENSISGAKTELKEQIDALAQDLDRLAGNVNTDGVVVEEIAKALAEAQKAIDALDDTYATDAELAAAKSALESAISGAKDEVREQIDDLAKELAGATSRISTAEGSISELTAALSDLKTAMDSADALIRSDFTAADSGLEESVTALEIAYEAADEAFEDAVARLQSEVDGIKEDDTDGNLTVVIVLFSVFTAAAIGLGTAALVLTIRRGGKKQA